MQTYSEVTARLSRLVDRLSVKDQEHLTAVVEQMMIDDDEAAPA